MEPTRCYPWQWFYELAILETDRTKLPMLIEAAQAAIDARIAEVESSRDVTAAEMQALDDARSGLRILIGESKSLDKSVG